MSEFVIFAAIGFLAQLIDGSLGMGYGMISSASLLVAGVPPAHASACTHAAKLFTSSTSAASHFALGNVDKRIFIGLAVIGSIFGVLGAFVITQLDGKSIKPYVMAYLSAVGIMIIWRSLRKAPQEGHRKPTAMFPGLVGAAGGFCDAIGGGGWGPVTTTSLIATGHNPRLTVGSVNTAEAVVTLSIIAAFAVTHLTGLWDGAASLWELAEPVAGLIAGGIPAAIIAGYLPKLVNARKLSAAVGVLIICLAGQQLWVMLR